MPSSKGEPDDPKLREKVKEEVKAMSKGGGPGSWSAWKAGELARRYEAQGGGYKDTGDNKNKAQAGAPQRKDGNDQKKPGEGRPDKNKKKEEEKQEKEERKEESKDDKKEEKKDEGGSGGAKGKGGSKKK